MCAKQHNCPQFFFFFQVVFVCVCFCCDIGMCMPTPELRWWWNSIRMVTKSTRQHLTAPIMILSTPHQWWMLHQQSVINENTQINFKGSTCQKSILMKRCISNAWVMVGVMIMIAMMNHMEAANKQSDFLAPHEKKIEEKLWVSKHLSVCGCVSVCSLTYSSY